MKIDHHYHMGLSLGQYTAGRSEEDGVKFVGSNSLHYSRVVSNYKGLEFEPDM